VALLGLALGGFCQHASSWEQGVWGAAVGGVTRLEDEGRARVEVAEDESGVYHVRLSRTFELHVEGTVEFYKRMLVIFLGLLEVPEESRGSRRTRDGRTPFVRQQQMAAWFGVPQPHISRRFKYWLERDWRRMLSQRWGEILTEEVRQRVMGSWGTFPWWSARRVWEHLQSQESRITLPQMKQIGQESG
jgi:hypothetical protein